MEISSKIMTCDYQFKPDQWETISKDAQNWVQRMLEPIPKDRFTNEQQMEHPWLKVLETDTLRRKYRIHPLVMKNLSSCNQPCQLHFVMLSLFTQFLDDEDINAIRETFQAMDEDNSGQIEIDELE